MVASSRSVVHTFSLLLFLRFRHFFSFHKFVNVTAIPPNCLYHNLPFKTSPASASGRCPRPCPRWRCRARSSCREEEGESIRLSTFMLTPNLAIEMHLTVDKLIKANSECFISEALQSWSKRKAFINFRSLRGAQEIVCFDQVYGDMVGRVP